MSDFLTSVPGEFLPASETPAQLQAFVRGKFVAQSWRVVSEDTSSVPCTLYVVPPATEAIGNTQTREVLFFEFGNDYINLRPVCEALLTYPETVCFYKNPSGAGYGLEFGEHFTNGFPGLNTDLIGGGSLQELYENLCNSTATRITDWIWQLSKHSPINTVDSTDYIVGIHKTGAAVGEGVQSTYTTNSGGTRIWDLLGGLSGASHGPGLQLNSEAAFVPASSITTDLVSGFILFLQINARGIALASRCNSGYYGPVHAVWGDHQFALDSMPKPTPGWEKFLSPIELMVGLDQNESTISSSARGTTAKAWTLGQGHHNLVAANWVYGAHPFTRVWPRGVFFDSNAMSVGPTYLISGFDGDSSSATLRDWPIHRVEGGKTFSNFGDSEFSRTCVIPAIRTDDWWRYRGSSPNENALCGAPDAPIATLTTALTRGGTETSVNLSSTAGMPTVGTVIIEGEPIPYAGISGNTLTGCTRGSYGQEKTAHAVGTAVSQGHYWVKINGGLIYCGIRQPVQG